MLRKLVIALALCASSSALQIGAPAVRTPALSRCASPACALPKFADAQALSVDEIEKELASAKKVRARPAASPSPRPARPARGASHPLARARSRRRSSSCCE